MDGARVAYAPQAVPCSLGRALIAATPGGLCWLALGDKAEELLADWQRRRAASRLEQWTDSPPADWIEAALAVLDGDVHRPAPPLAPLGTPFQQRVWALLRTIQPGATLTYRALAARLGRPSAARAVAAACAANPLAVLIPCHRVVGSDGDLRGYRWGLERKRTLLRREGAAV